MRISRTVIFPIAALVCALLTAPAWAQTSANAPDLEAIIRDYTAAWREPDHDKRAALLAKAWAPDGVYIDPQAHVKGRKKLVEHIGLVMQMFPSSRVIEKSQIDFHHGVFRFAWRSSMPDGTVLLEGVDFGELDAQGRIRRIVGFFGPLELAKTK